MKLSIVIVNYNVEHFLEQCLRSVRNAIKNIETEVFIVDNDSVDGSVEMVKREFPEFYLIESKENLGFSGGNNLAMRIAKGEYVLLLNPDTLVEEDTFEKVCNFMDEHSDAGGLGVKMVDGKGNFLPESKRGLPTPTVAFYKIFGLSTFFPKSKRFGKYHLGYLDKDENHEVEILSGAFMLMRKEALNKVGLLDEDFFMYGEDIDLSYRIIKGGYKNYYFSETRIIHYKGESTKKGSLNYVKVFYNAMIIFAKKHFSDKNAKTFSFLINIAVYLRAALAIGKRIIERIFQPLLDGVLIYGGMFFLKNYWEKYHRYVEGGEYPELFTRYIIPLYILFWITGIYLKGGYDKQSKLSDAIKGGLIGALVLFITYGFVPEEYRFSRALILLGSVAALIITSFRKILVHFVQTGNFSVEQNTKKRVLIIGDSEEKDRVSQILNNTNMTSSFIATAYVNEDKKSSDDLGGLHQLEDIVRIYNIDEIIFCAGDIRSDVIIDTMVKKGLSQVDYKIAPPESLFIIGSNSIHTNGELYTIDINSISKKRNQRTKRLLDLTVSFIVILFLPIFIFLTKKPYGLMKNLFLVLFGKLSWVGYQNAHKNPKNLPVLKKGILGPSAAYKEYKLTEATIVKLNILYAKDYQAINDLNIIFKGVKDLGKSVI